MIFFRLKKNWVWGILCPTKYGGNHASQWIRDLWLKGVSLILSYFWTFLSFWVFGDFFRFSKKSGFWVFLVHPPMASVLLSASVERCFVSRMRDFSNRFRYWPSKNAYTVCVGLSKIHRQVCVGHNESVLAFLNPYWPSWIHIVPHESVLSLLKCIDKDRENHWKNLYEIEWSCAQYGKRSCHRS